MLFRLGLIFAIIFTLIVCAGCLFEPRDPEPPGTSSIDYFDANTAENVISNLQLALEGRDPNGYERMLSDDFSYEPDGGTLANYSEVDWENWGKEQETAFVSSFLSNVEGVTADLRAETFGDITGDTEAELRYVYALKVLGLGNSEVPYRAQATLWLLLEGTEWRLTRWIDEQGENDPDTGALLPSLGQRRGAFAASGGS